jgi:hypothetical protein
MSQQAQNAKMITRKLAERGIHLVNGQQKTGEGLSRYNPYFHLFSESYGEESVFYPAQHMSMHSEAEIRALRDFLNEILGEGESDLRCVRDKIKYGAGLAAEKDLTVIS